MAAAPHPLPPAARQQEGAPVSAWSCRFPSPLAPDFADSWDRFQGFCEAPGLVLDNKHSDNKSRTDIVTS